MNPEFEEFFSANFNSTLSAEQEKQFSEWAKEQSQLRGRDVLKDLANYDLKGYWLKMGSQDGGKGHMTDEFKKPNHPTFSDQSIYNGKPSPFGMPWEGGKWSEDGKSYTPSQTMLRTTHKIDALKDYMNHIEPGVNLVSP